MLFILLVTTLGSALLCAFFAYLRDLIDKAERKSMAIDYNHRERSAAKTRPSQISPYHKEEAENIVEFFSHGSNVPIASTPHRKKNPWESTHTPQQSVSIVNGYELVGYHNPEDATRAAQQTSAAVWREILSKA